MKRNPIDHDAQLEAVLRALCIVTHVHTTPTGAAYGVNPRLQRKLAWAQDIVRQVAEQPIPAIEGSDD